MIGIPKSVEVARDSRAEEALLLKARSWVETERQEGIHASDILDPLLAYWNRRNPVPLSDRLANIFFVGKILHSFVLGIVDGNVIDLTKTDEGTKFSEELGIWYSQDRNKNGRPQEFKSSRGYKDPVTVDDLSVYIEQLLVYMAAENSLTGDIWLLLLNLKDETGKTSPAFRVYKIVISKEDLVGLKHDIISTRVDLEFALEQNETGGLPLCREFKCGKGNCPHWDLCKPLGRWGNSKWK